MARRDPNRWTGIGRLCADPEFKYLPDGTPLANLRIAVNRGKEYQGQSADFFSITAWKQDAEFAANNLVKGDLVFIEGRLEIQQWAAQDGTKRYSTTIKASLVQSLTSKGTGQQREEVAPALEAGAAPEGDFPDPFADQ